MGLRRTISELALLIRPPAGESAAHAQSARVGATGDDPAEIAAQSRDLVNRIGFFR